MKLYFTPGSDDRRSVYPGKNGPTAGLPDPCEVLRVHWSRSGCSQYRPVAELKAYYVSRLDECEEHLISGDEMTRFRRYQSQTGWRGWSHYIDIAHVLYLHGVPDADTAPVVAVLDDDDVAGGSLCVQDTLFH